MSRTGNRQLKVLERCDAANRLIMARREAHRLWTACCEHDGIPVDTSFAVFSKDNPYVAEHQKAMIAVLRRGY